MYQPEEDCGFSGGLTTFIPGSFEVVIVNLFMSKGLRYGSIMALEDAKKKNQIEKMLLF